MLRTLALLALIAPVSAQADICDYRPSKFVGGAASGGGAAFAGTIAVAGAGAKAAGFYTLTNAVTGATMLGSAAGGASAAGTVGIMGGTAGAIGTVAAFVMAPATIIAGAAVGSGIAIYEGACYFTVERIEDPEIIVGIVENLAATADAEYLRLTVDDDEDILLIAKSHDNEGNALEWDRFSVSNLYVEEGMLMHRDWGPNSVIGRVGLVAKKSVDE